MSNIVNVLFLSFAVTVTACEQDVAQPLQYYSCTATAMEQNADHPLAPALTAFMADRIGSGIPGMLFTVHDPVFGTWSGAAGKAELIGGVDMEVCQITRVGSTVKTFTAVAILQLWEEGRIDLDAPVRDFLSADTLDGLTNAENATVRQLLQHSAGINNYIRSAKFQTASLNDLTRVWQPAELLEYSRGVAPQFPIGTDVDYSNTGYILLGMIIEEVTGMPFYRYFEQRIFEPYQLNFTQFAAEDPVPDGIVRGYIDLYDNGQLIEATDYSGWDYFTADGGLISNPYDLNRFMRLLFTGQIIGEEALDQMITFIYPKEEDPELFRTGYGLGIFSLDTEFGPAYLHSGDAIGYFASMAYFPEHDVTVSWAANGNYGTLDDLQQSRETMQEIFRSVLAE